MCYYYSIVALAWGGGRAMNKKAMFLWGVPLVLGMAVGVGASGTPSVQDGINARVASPMNGMVAKMVTVPAKMVAIPAVAPTSGPAGRDIPSTKNPTPPAGTLGRAGVTSLTDSGAEVGGRGPAGTLGRAGVTNLSDSDTEVDGGGPAGMVINGDVSGATGVDSSAEDDSGTTGEGDTAAEDSWQQQWYRMGLTLGVLESSPDFSYKQAFRLFSARTASFTAGQEYFGLAPRRTSAAPRYVPLAEF